MKRTVNILNTYLQFKKPVTLCFNNKILILQYTVLYTHFLGRQLISDLPNTMCKIIYIFLRINLSDIMVTGD
jgi:hypothetical protein